MADGDRRAEPRAVYYEALPSRSAATGGTLLGEYDGVVIVDGYAAYPVVARGSPGMILVHCWAHVRSGFIAHGRVPLDNNLIERSLRPVALGRKTHLGSKSPRGIETMGILYSVIETCKLAGVDPREYVLLAVHAALESPRRLVLPSELGA